MFVIVYLIQPRVHTVVPHKFVYELSHVNLYNNGINSNQSRLIYFSTELFDALKNGDEIDENEYVPNFNIPISVNYPLQNNIVESCFIARLRKFYGE